MLEGPSENKSIKPEETKNKQEVERR